MHSNYTIKTTIAFLLIACLPACELGPGGEGDIVAGQAAAGGVNICTTVVLSDNDEEILTALDGVVSALNDGSVDCSESVTILDADNQTVTVGYTLTDADGDDITPPLDLEVGDAVTGLHRSIAVWGTVEGLVLEDGLGLVLAADQNYVGGGLENADLPFSVFWGESAVVTDTSDPCRTATVYEVVFETDESTPIAPVSSAEITVDGQLVTAHAIAATDEGPGLTCEIMDISDHLAWAVVR